MIFDTLENLEMYSPLVDKIKVVADTMDHDDVYDKAPGKYTTRDPKVSYTVYSYVTSSADKPFEFHKKHTDVIIVLSGQELMSSSWRELQRNCNSFDEVNDTGFFVGEPISVLQAAQGRFSVFFPGEPHKSGVALGEPSLVKKVVFKIED